MSKKKTPLILTAELADTILNNEAHALSIDIRDAHELDGPIEVLEDMSSRFAALARDAAEASVYVQSRLKRKRRDKEIEELVASKDWDKRRDV